MIVGKISQKAGGGHGQGQCRSRTEEGVGTYLCVWANGQLDNQGDSAPDHGGHYDRCYYYYE